ncbi:DNA-binding transcriptional regulator NtrC [bioreactor metagenome]|jgi:transcriptional regulator with PAS, ATPase and Fis domain|uniref:DNA-binding transcriptional regulator NtrC n=1 Tax=bioreactor metagenome TaxID=1076179 RepID=A0A644VS32_9ZZZZ|nr:sigma-54-dependent Fis family transcriptional regulator [Bacteroidales bacterium]WRQ32187.1 sigma-54 dependent transcriptional regulator [Bacteroidales bacterium MB20-C3-3]MBP6454054.1 sigma-54-dependent Fis family transcriptional regulator [Bacteroidales bacterium]MBP8677161.1 sigma-54-dependent Fis family transcriptional regulator [Bacteroidales bacterium]MBP9584431.1 sigma-54-dependent Fis family transcriptional regulator [Bacteroidales bacterium]
MDMRSLKQRFDIIGNNPALDMALETAVRVAGTDLSVLITGESGVGKEVVPQIIHSYSPRKHKKYIAVNCGAIPEGTIDSELFGHEKGAFTGAVETRKGYFEVADEGTLFLDEVAELPLSTQVRLLRVLQTGEFIKVGSSKVEKTDVRVVAATNKNLMRAIEAGKFREDLYYRLNTVPITIPSLRERKDDIYLLFRKFAVDFAERYKMPSIKLTDPARVMLESYRWPGNIRQLKSLAEQISVIEHNREIGPEDLVRYLPAEGPEYLPVKTSESQGSEYLTDRDIIFKILYQLRHEVEELKKRLETKHQVEPVSPVLDINKNFSKSDAIVDYEEDVVLSIQNVNAELIKKALEKHGGKRKLAAAELGISERTLYRKIKELNLDL